MSRVAFDVVADFTSSSERVWRELVDWKGHEAWIPATKVDTGAGDPTAPGATFVAWTGYGPLKLEDRMRVVSCDWSSDRRGGRCEVEKLGPVLKGRAWFTVEPAAAGARVEWFEDVSVPWLPKFLAPLAGRLGAIGFSFGMRRLEKLLSASPDPDRAPGS